MDTDFEFDLQDLVLTCTDIDVLWAEFDFYYCPICGQRPNEYGAVEHVDSTVH